jgi:hypothetical protein
MTDVINDAEAYGVEIIPAAVEPGQLYWKVIRVHHLTPEENGGRHHIFLDAVNGSDERLYGTLFTIFWDGGGDTVTIEKQPPEAGANFPMWKWQVCSVEGMGAPSDRVINLRTDHPDEAPGNTLFHHSFAITYLHTIAEESETPASSSISGHAPGGGGHTLDLLNAENVVKTLVVAADERYLFDDLPAGAYTVYDRSDLRVAGPVFLDGVNAVILDFAEPLPEDRVVARYFLFGDVATPETQLYLSLLSDHLAQNAIAFGFDVDDAAQATAVSLIGHHPQETVDALESAGCQVEALPTDPSELLAAI